MNKLKIATSLSIIAIIFILIINSSVMVYNIHLDKQYLVMEKKVEESALRCYNESTCQTTEITLKELYEKEYLTPVVNPRNKEYLKEETTISINPTKNEATLNLS